MIGKYPLFLSCLPAKQSGQLRHGVWKLCLSVNGLWQCRKNNGDKSDQSSICWWVKFVRSLTNPAFDLASLVRLANVSGYWTVQHLLIWLMCQVTDQSNICWYGLCVRSLTNPTFVDVAYVLGHGICVRSLTNPTFVDVAYVSGHGPTFDLASCSGFGPAQHLLTWQMCQVTYQSNIWSGKFVRSNIWPGKFARSLNSSTSVNMVNWSDHWP